MMQDALNLFDDAAALTTTRISTNVIQRNAIDNATINVAGGKYVPRLVVTVETAFSGTGGANLAVAIESDDNAGLSSPTVHFTSGDISADLANTGVVLDVPFPAGDYEEFIGLRFTNSGSALSAGTITAAIVIDSDDQRKYANRSNITPVS